MAADIDEGEGEPGFTTVIFGEKHVLFPNTLHQAT